jgi:hypothetical protein
MEAAGTRCVWDRNDVAIIIGALADILVDVREIRAVLREIDEEEENEDEP